MGGAISSLVPKDHSRAIGGRVLAWFIQQRTSARVAFVLRCGTMALSLGLSLFWTRLLLEAMGAELNGLFLAFLAIVQLGGIGDLGISSAMGVRVMQHLSRGEDEEGQRFLASSRGVIVSLALALGGIFIALAPKLPRWLSFGEFPGTGSLSLLFAVGGCGLLLLIINGYFQTLNYINGNVVWPVLPAFVLTQLTFAGQLLIARWNGPLWSQYGWHVIVAALGVVVAWWMLRISHPWLANLKPIRFEGREMRLLVGMSFWSYLATLGNLLFVTTDRIIVNAGFGSDVVPSYQFNYKLFETGIIILGMVTFVALPAIVRRLLSPDQEQQAAGYDQAVRVQKLQAFAATACALAFLAVNDRFISIWIGSDFQVPLSLQVAFALTFAVTTGGEVGIQLLGRLDHRAIRIAGLSIGGAGVLNLVLSLAAARLGSILGIALATVVAQSVVSLVMSYHTSRLLRTSWTPWVFRGWAIPLVFVLAGAVFRAVLPPIDPKNAVLLATAFLLLLGILAPVLGLRRQMLVDEWRRMRTVFS